jgi:hypothetical protein
VQTNPFVQSVQVLPKNLDDTSVIEFTLKSEQVEAFDYLTDQPSKLIVDFYYNEELKSDTGKTKVKKKPPKSQRQSCPKKVQTRSCGCGLFKNQRH